MPTITTGNTHAPCVIIGEPLGRNPQRLILPIREAPPGNEDVSRFPRSWPGFMTYIAPVAERVAGFSAADLTWVLVIVGVGLVIGKRDPIQYALETDWPVGAGGFEPLHFRIGIRQDSQPGGGTRTCASRMMQNGY